MKDNISLVIITIVSVLVLIILPLVSVLQRQDDMSYNLVMKLTTSFADDVREKGYVDIPSYNKLLQGLTATGNTYDIQMEAHKKILIKADDWQEDQPLYKEATLIDYNKDIFEQIENGNNIYKKIEIETSGEAGKIINNKSGVYLLKKGDEFYVKIKNTNVTSASLVYGYISGKSNSKIININYGGIINNKSWDKYSDKESVVIKEPEIRISLPKNQLNITPVKVELVSPDEYNYNYYFNLQDSNDRELKFIIDIKNATKMNDEITGLNYDLKIPDYISFEGFRANVTVVKKADFKYEVTLKNIFLTEFSVTSSECIIIVKDGLAENEYAKSSKTEGEIFTINDTDNIHSVIILGPYKGGTDILLWNNISGKHEIESGQLVYFTIQYEAIKATPIQSDIINKVKLFNFPYTGNITVTDISYNSLNKKGSARINIRPITGHPSKLEDNYLMLEEGTAKTITDANAHSTMSVPFDILPIP